jgi:hypothetical protein
MELTKSLMIFIERSFSLKKHLAWLGRVPEEFPHIHKARTDATGCFGHDFFVKEVHILFLAAFVIKLDSELLTQI